MLKNFSSYITAEMIKTIPLATPCTRVNPSDLRYFCEKCQKYLSFKHVLKRTGVD